MISNTSLEMALRKHEIISPLLQPGLDEAEKRRIRREILNGKKYLKGRSGGILQLTGRTATKDFCQRPGRMWDSKGRYHRKYWIGR